MSSYSSLSRVLSPFRVQTKFEENTLPARRIVEMSFYCVVLTYPLPDPFPVNIFQDNLISENEMIPKAELTFGHLKQMIVRVMEKSPTVYKNICEVKSLWKVEGLAEGDNKWTILEEIANDKDETSIEQKLRAFGNKLKS
ncbi:8350_t:CDS:2, partial [Funneliformis mosseae]